MSRSKQNYSEACKIQLQSGFLPFTLSFYKLIFGCVSATHVMSWAEIIDQRNLSITCEAFKLSYNCYLVEKHSESIQFKLTVDEPKVKSKLVSE